MRYTKHRSLSLKIKIKKLIFTTLQKQKPIQHPNKTRYRSTRGSWSPKPVLPKNITLHGVPAGRKLNPRINSGLRMKMQQSGRDIRWRGIAVSKLKDR